MKKNKLCINKRIAFLVVGIFVLGIIGFAIFSIGNGFNPFVKRISNGKRVFTNVPTYPLGIYFYISWQNNLVRFDERTRMISNLTHLSNQPNSDPRIRVFNLVMSNNKKFFYVMSDGEVWKMDLNGKMVKQITNTGKKVDYYIISPNEEFIAYELTRINNGGILQARRYLINLTNNNISEIPTNHNPIPYNQADAELSLTMWIDNSNIQISTNGNPGYIWNREDNSFKTNKIVRSQNSSELAGRSYPSPNGKYKALITTSVCNLILYNDKHENILENFDCYSRNASYYDVIGWTPDSRFFIFQLSKATHFSDALGVIDVINKKTSLYSIEKLTAPVKDADIYVPSLYSTTGSVAGQDNRVITVNSGKVYFSIELPFTGKRQKNVDRQLWVFDIRQEAFEKIRDYKENSEWDFASSDLYWTN